MINGMIAIYQTITIQQYKKKAFFFGINKILSFFNRPIGANGLKWPYQR